MLFHMVRCLIGEEAFWGGLRDVYRTRRFQEASWRDFAEAFGERAGTDLRSFFDQWVDRSGAPSLRLEHLSARQQGDGYEVRGALRQTSPFYDLMVPVRLEDLSGGTTLHWVHLKDETASFSLDCQGSPARFIVDPDVSLLRRLHPSEIPRDINMLRASSSLAVVMARGAPREWREALAMLLTGLGRQEASIIDEDRFDPEAHRDRDLLFVGVPEHREWLPPYPKGFSVQPDAFEWGGRRFTKSSDALFAVLPAPHASERTVALFLPLAPEAAIPVAGKISHYGSFSLLVFEEGTNVVKQTWPIEDSPLVHRFSETSGH
jgi:hypothetical protein